MNLMFLLHTSNKITNANSKNCESKASNDFLLYFNNPHYNEFCYYFLEFLSRQLLYSNHFEVLDKKLNATSL